MGSFTSPIRSLRTTGLVALVTLTGLVSSLAVPDKSSSTPTRPLFPSLINATIEDVTSGLDTGLFTTVDLVKAYLARIDEVNAEFHAVTEINPDALAIAAELDAERQQGASGCKGKGKGKRGPLHGIPVLIKDNIVVNGAATAGSLALVGARVTIASDGDDVGADATVVEKLRRAGAVVLGKTNLSQWADFRSSNSSNGWSAVGGQTVGAYYPRQDPGGSSSGSGVACSLGLAAVCIGTETIGSIISPAQSNNLVGIKPTVGLTSRHLVVPVSSHHDTVGPMARTVRDAALVLSAIAGPDPRDNYTSAIPGDVDYRNYAADLDPNFLTGARLGVPSNILPPPEASAGDALLEGFYAAIETLRELGAEVLSNADVADPAAPKDFSIIQADFVADLANYLSPSSLTVNPTDVHTLADVRAFTQMKGEEEYPDRDTAVFDSALGLGYTNTDAEFFERLRANEYAGGEAGVLGAIEGGELDALVLPSVAASGWAALVGAPVVKVPLGFYPDDGPVVTTGRGLVVSGPGVPFGLSFLGPKWSEATLIKLAYAFEQKTAVREKGPQPYVVPKTEVV